MIRSLVTGGAGFIGGHIVRFLVSIDHVVDVVDNLHTGDMRNVPQKANFHKLDVGNDSLDFLFCKPYDFIFHFAGQSSVELSFQDPLYDLDTNVRSSLKLFNLCKSMSPFSHIFYASSMSVYGALGTFPKDELSELQGKNFYAVGKKLTEEYASIFCDLGLRITCLRFFNIYGPGQNLENLSQGMVSIYLAQALLTNQIVVKGSLQRTRDFVFISDVISAISSLMNNHNSFSKTINICSGIEHSVSDVISVINSILPSPVPVIASENTIGDISRMLGSNSLLFDIIKRLEFVPLREGILKMYSSYLDGTYYE